MRAVPRVCLLSTTAWVLGLGLERVKPYSLWSVVVPRASVGVAAMVMGVWRTREMWRGVGVAGLVVAVGNVVAMFLL